MTQRTLVNSRVFYYCVVNPHLYWPHRLFAYCLVEKVLERALQMKGLSTACSEVGSSMLFADLVGWQSKTCPLAGPPDGDDRTRHALRHDPPDGQCRLMSCTLAVPDGRSRQTETRLLAGFDGLCRKLPSRTEERPKFLQVKRMLAYSIRPSINGQPWPRSHSAYTIVITCVILRCVPLSWLNKYSSSNVLFWKNCSKRFEMWRCVMWN